LLEHSEQAGDPAAERRVVTVLFGDLSDFTAWSEDLDPERVGAVTDEVLGALTKAVTDFGGTIDKLTGDGVMAVFGAPAAHEDDTERAVRAAAQMQAEVRRLMAEESGGGRRMGLRVGLNTGEVLAGVQAALSYTVVGDTVNTASRLADAASVGSVYAGRATALSTMSIASWRALSPLRLKGKRERVPAYELVGLRPSGAARLDLGEEAPFIGRDAEFGRLVGRMLDVVDRGKPASVVVTGEAGVGKTRLAVELAHFAGELPHVRVLWGRCPPYGESRDLAAFADWVRTAVGITDSDDVEASISRVKRTVTRLAHPALRRPLNTSTADRLLALLGLVEWAPVGPRDTATPGGGETVIDPLAEAVIDLVNALGSEGPLLLVVDDAQWGTPSLLAALGRLAIEFHGPALFVTVGRSDLMAADWWDQMPDLEVLPVVPLDEPASERLLRAYLGGAELDHETRELLLDRAQGNPFFLAEMLHLLVDRGLLRRDGDGWRLTGELPRGVLPAGVRAVLAARIDSLAPAARALLRDASVIGERFTAEMLRSLEPAMGDGDDPVIAALEELVARGIVQPIADGAEGAPQYTFTHGLARDVAYAGIPKAERARRHATVARWAIDGSTRAVGETDAFVASQAEQAVLLATEMRLPPKDPAWTVRDIGFGALERLGQATLARDDNLRAEALFGRALALADGHLDDAATAPVLVGRAAARVSLHRLDEAESDLERPLALRDQRMRAAALVVLGDVLRRRGEEGPAVEALVRALATASEAGYDRVAGEALRQLGMIEFLGGRFAAAEQHFEQALSLAERVGDRRGAGWALQHLAWSATTRGAYEIAEQRLGTAADVFSSLEDDGGLSWCAGTEAFVRLLQGRLEQARALAQGLLPLGQAVGDRWGVAACLTIDGLAAAELGQIQAATEAATAAYDGFHDLGDPWGESIALLAMGAALRAAGRQRRAIRRLDQAVARATESRQPVPAALALAMLAECRVELGDLAAAEAATDTALETLRSLEVLPGAIAGLQLVRAQVLRAKGDPAAAAALLRETLAIPEGSLAFPRRRALACLTEALLDLDDPAGALDCARQSMAEPAQDVRSRGAALRAMTRALHAVGDLPAARFAARQAVALAGATEARNDLDAAQQLLDGLPG
jgi:class 3 adenylate cyclase/tetratricopeptide (TPR) repeat protein